MEKTEPEAGVILILASGWLLFEGIRVIISLTLFEDPNLIYRFTTDISMVIYTLIGIVGILAGLLIWKGNRKGNMLTLIVGISGIATLLLDEFFD